MSGPALAEVALLARWLLLLELAGWAFYPLLYLALPGLRDRGLTMAKPFALLVLVYPSWFIAALGLPVFTAAALVATLALGGILAWGLAIALPRRAPCGPPSLLAFLRAGWRYALAAEALFIAAFLGYAWLRGYTPHIAGTEKPMEIGFLAAATRQDLMPPRDPWLSGHGINYYYLGYAIVAGLAKVTVTPAATAFNLGLATLFAATLTGGTGLTANLLAKGTGCARQGDDGARGSETHPRPALHAPHPRTLGTGLLGGYLLALAGNMYAARDILTRGRAALDAWWWEGLGWRSSRVVIDSGWPATRFGLEPQLAETINEFPAFSFLLGDLHAHVLALPFTLLALAFALDIWRAPALAPGYVPGTARAETPTDRTIGIPPARAVAPRLLAAAFSIGALYPINSWDLPTYAALYLTALLVPLWRGTARGRRRFAGRGLLATAVFAACCVAFFAPFHARFIAFISGQPLELPEPWRSVPGLLPLARVIGLVSWDKTPAAQFFTIYLLPYAAGLMLLLGVWHRHRAGTGRAMPLAVILTLAIGAALLRMPVLFFAALMIVLGGAVAFRGGRIADRFAALLFGAAFALVLVTEFVYLYDIFNHRVNTVFKVYYQTWTLLAIAAGYAVARLLASYHPRVARGRRDALDVPARAPWCAPLVGVLALLLIAAAAYPLAAGRARAREFPARMGMDGLAVIRAAHPEEWAGITWVYAHIPAGAVVAEAPGCSYGDFANLPHNRVAAFAGVSTLVGWAAHQRQWRSGSPDLLAALGPRITDLNTLYRTTDPGEAAAILDRYDIGYVYVGRFERDGYMVGGVGTPCGEGGAYPPAGIAKFDALMERAFASENGGVVVYRRR